MTELVSSRLQVWDSAREFELVKTLYVMLVGSKPNDVKEQLKRQREGLICVMNISKMT